jgi:hypothetical protein
MPERRPVSPEEIEVVRWLLANGAMRDVSAYQADSLRGAEVVAACPCGCASIDFVVAGAPEEPRPPRASQIIAEAITRWPDGAQAGVMLWGEPGRVHGIELYELGGDDVAHRSPTVESLRRWEDYYDGDGVSLGR